MIEFGYLIDRDTSLATIGWAQVSAALLRYDCFLGDVYFRINDIDLSMRWGWIPVLDFAISMKHVVQELRRDKSASFDFTDSDLRINFVEQGGRIRISAEYSEEIAEVMQRDFEEAVKRLAEAVSKDIEKRHPELLRNEYYLDAIHV